MNKEEKNCNNKVWEAKIYEILLLSIESIFHELKIVTRHSASEHLTITPSTTYRKMR